MRRRGWKLRVLIVELFLPESIYTLELGRELKKFCELSVFCRKDAGVSEEGIRWIPAFYPGGKGKFAAAWEYGVSLWKLAKTIRKGKFDVVHVQTFKDVRFELPVYNRLKKYYGKLVLTAHNVLPHEAGRREKEKYRKLYESCDELIAHNETTAEGLKKEFAIPQEKISVIPHGTYRTHSGRKKAKKKDGKIHFLQFGYIRKYKGVDILLRAAAEIPKEYRKRLCITIAGKQYRELDETDYESMIQNLGLGDCVKLIKGHIPDDRLSELLSEADFLVFPYRHIYGSGALMFSYTYRKPVIASNIPAFAEETGNGRTGILFDSENPQALADAIMKAAECTEEQIDQYEKEISRLAAEKYNWERSAARTAEVYRKQKKRGSL